MTEERYSKETAVETYEWLSAKDGYVRDSHSFVDGQRIPKGKRFSNGLKYPHEPGAPAEEVINCRCTLLPVIS